MDRHAGAESITWLARRLHDALRHAPALQGAACIAGRGSAPEQVDRSLGRAARAGHGRTSDDPSPNRRDGEPDMFLGCGLAPQPLWPRQHACIIEHGRDHAPPTAADRGRTERAAIGARHADHQFMPREGQ
jgi:hypothetical protein